MGKTFRDNMKSQICSLVALVLVAVMIMPLSAIETFATDNLYSFTTIDGKTVQSYSSDYDVTINVFGRVTCPNTQNILKDIIKLDYDKADEIKVNFIDCDAQSKDVITEFAKNFSGSLIDFCFDTGSSAQNAMWEYARSTGVGNSVTLPVVAFVNGDGSIRKVTTGVVTANYLTNIISNGEVFGENLKFTITGTDNYDYAYTVLDSLNKTRRELGLNELEMDKELLDVAMQRAAEISIYYSHTRPNNESCFSLVSGYGYMGENIAVGQISPKSVMDSWTNSSGHYANMVNELYNSVGIGCFKTSNGVYCWVQFFSSDDADVISQSGSAKTSHNITAEYSNLSLSLSPSSVSLPFAKKGDKFDLKIDNKNVGFSYVTQKLDASNFNFSSSDSNVVSVDKNGQCVVQDKGEATLTVSLKSNSKVTFSCTAELGHDHNYSGWIIDEEATLYSAGSKHKECTICGEILRTATIKQLKCAKPVLKTVSNVGANVKITWGAVEGVDLYRVYRKIGTGSYEYVGSTSKTYFTDKEAPAGKICRYLVKAKNEAGYSEASASLAIRHFDKPELKTIENSAYGVKLDWDKISGAKTYNVYRKVSGGTYKYLAETSNTYYTDKTASSGKKYYYAIRAKDGDSVSSQSASLSKYYLEDPVLSAPISTTKGVDLKWSQVAGAEGYMIYRKTGSSGSYTRIATENGVSNLYYRDTDAKKGKKYYYKVKAYKSKTYSAYSNTKSVTDKY